MFVADCTACGLRQLRSPRAIAALERTGGRLVLHFVCRGCGAHGTVDPGPLQPGLSTAY
jgi:hypothetical protein